ncbi:hypothetical protein HGA15_13875 [Nocardia flavorosea]|uniref:DUF3987 domain-containing protein n=1 Tax=Nocardia flavorosea TaxID=53429 RepID=A0A846YHT3_9NOCA|nr:hypothetical protein [Nocardia flavorosea]
MWDTRPVLGDIRDFARARQAGPWATLGVVLARAVAATEPNMVLPPLVGSDKSLNLFVALVGSSGGGKGAAEGAAADAVEFVDGNGRQIIIEEFPVGSGEGVARTFLPSDEPRTRALFTAAEVDTVSALGGRKGSTLMPELRKVYAGEQIGFANASKDTRTPLAAHSYRACLTIGVQPLKAGPLLDDADGGTPQRFLWLKVTDPYAPAGPLAAPEPVQVKVKAYTAARVRVTVPDIARDAIRRHRLAVLREEDVNPLDGHRMLTALKVGAALAILDGRIEITEEDWKLAGAILRVSDHTRAQVQQSVAEQSRSANRARALAAAERNEVISDHAEQRARDRVRGSVLRYLDRRTVATRKELRVNLRSELRSLLDSELGELESEGAISYDGTVYRRPEGRTE